MLFGKIPVTYINRKMKNTYGEGGVKVKKYILDSGGRKITVENYCLDEKLAFAVREGKIKSIRAVLS